MTSDPNLINQTYANILNEDLPTGIAAPSPAFHARYHVVRDGSISACRVYDPKTSTISTATTVIMRLNDPQEAYWIRKNMRESIGGTVLHAVVLKRYSAMPHVIAEEMSRQNIIWALTEERVVVKQFDLRCLTGSQWQMMNNEVKALRYIEAHHRIVPFKSIVVPVDILTSTLTMLWIVLPFYQDGDLFEFAFASGQRLDERQARIIFRQSILGLIELRRIGMFHRDIAPENMMIHNDGIIHIDFGTARLVPFDESSGDRMLVYHEDVAFGRWAYLPPETASNRDFDGYSLDLWAIIVILYRLVTGELPWDRAHLSDNAFQLVRHGRLDLLLRLRGIKLSPSLVDLFHQFFREDPRDRLGLNQILNHPWLNSGDL